MGIHLDDDDLIDVDDIKRILRKNKVKVIKVKQDSIPKLTSKAQTAFNKWIRNRDKDSGCISCGSQVDHAGHYLSAGHHGHLRFNEMNVNGQCLRCNNFLHGNLINYRQGLVNRYGEDKVKMLEACTRDVGRHGRPELIAIIQEYKTKLT